MITAPTRTRTRLAAAVLGVALVGTACSATEETADDGAAGTSSASGSETGTGGSALDDLRDPAFPEPLVPLDDLLSGGPPPDGIPAIDDPQHEEVTDVDWLEADEPVLSLTVGEETRAYPLRVLTWHEIANDVVGGVPVAVTYCPLCNSGVAFERTVDGEETTFGVSGLLYADNLVMFDRATESLWPQLSGQASVGVRTGTRLRSIPMGTVGWSQFRAEHPDALVLSRTTGHDRDYGRNPYVGYDDPDSDPIFPLPGEPDDRLAAKVRVVGVGTGADAVAVERDRLADVGTAAVRVGSRPVTLWHLPGQRSALGADRIAEGEEIGTVAAFVSRLDGDELTFERGPDDTVRDVGTGSTWNAFGRATDGELAGEQLRPVVHLDTFWFSWVAFQPDTTLVAP
ncbi:hypothetical protein I601_4008 [Nocardioides dokdonensis FR1436]|uniref:DUF3179 domain-containing protein n=1 Tax=Nocardioides dokdonensis FR1436 TaxID=1300347 RepID=A0A1A9GQ16_9ACTN|nr:DUF3179 domain-containing protein [Nocardioides dokdonensis]ANH40404.1 hypothetical protein I601_4008 [Nocardioides dokdonensis FR1436]